VGGEDNVISKTSPKKYAGKNFYRYPWGLRRKRLKNSHAVWSQALRGQNLTVGKGGGEKSWIKNTTISAKGKRKKKS